jgi:hypothetical protein
MKIPVNTDKVITITPNLLIQKWHPNPQYSLQGGAIVNSLRSVNLNLFP